MTVLHPQSDFLYQQDDIFILNQGPEFWVALFSADGDVYVPGDYLTPPQSQAQQQQEPVANINSTGE